MSFSLSSYYLLSPHHIHIFVLFFFFFLVALLFKIGRTMDCLKKSHSFPSVAQVHCERSLTVCASLGVRPRGSAYFITNTLKNYWCTTGYIEGVLLPICGPLPNDEKTPETELRKKNVTKWILEHEWSFQQWKPKEREIKKNAFMPVSWRGHYAIGSSWYTGAFFYSFRGSYPHLS